MMWTTSDSGERALRLCAVQANNRRQALSALTTPCLAASGEAFHKIRALVRYRADYSLNFPPS